MSVDSSQMQSHSNFSDFLSTHKGIAIGGGVILLVVIGAIMLKNKSSKSLPASSTTGAADLSGLSGGKVYVPTSTSFSTENIKYGAQINSNDPNLTSVTGSQTLTGATTTRNPPPPHPGPPPTGGKGLIWDKRYTIPGHETLSIVAASITRQLRAQGMPGSMNVTWADLYGHNASQIDSVRAAHGDHVPVSARSAQFFNMSITIPRWG